MSFGGKTYDAARDGERLSGQLSAVRSIMADGEWRSLAEIVEALEDDGVIASEAGVSARLRDLRKDKFGAHTVERKHVACGLWRYRLIINTGAQAAA